MRDTDQPADDIALNGTEDAFFVCIPQQGVDFVSLRRAYHALRRGCKPHQSCEEAGYELEQRHHAAPGQSLVKHIQNRRHVTHENIGTGEEQILGNHLPKYEQHRNGHGRCKQLGPMRSDGPTEKVGRDYARGEVVNKIVAYQHCQQQPGPVAQTSAEHDKRQLFLFDSQPQTQPAESVHARFGAGEQTGHDNKEHKRQYHDYVIAHRF